MSGIFTYRGNFSLLDIPRLDGKVALVTGGQAGIGQEISTQLLTHGIQKLFILARSERKFNGALEEWRQRSDTNLQLDSGPNPRSTGDGDEHGDTETSNVEFVQCDLADMVAVRQAVEYILKRTDRLDMLFCNAGLPTLPDYALSPQGIETLFATNCVGHFVLTNLLLPLLKSTVSTHGASDVRIVVTSSSLHSFCKELDFDLLTSPTRTKSVCYDGIWRYGRSKAGNILFTRELSRRLMLDGAEAAAEQAASAPASASGSSSGSAKGPGPSPGTGERKASERIYVNCFFPGNIATEQMDVWKKYFGTVLGWLFKRFFRMFGQSTQDGATTAMFLATSPKVTEGEGMKGGYFIPVAKRDAVSKLAQDENLARELWEWCNQKASETLGTGWQNR